MRALAGCMGDTTLYIESKVSRDGRLGLAVHGFGARPIGARRQEAPRRQQRVICSLLQSNNSLTGTLSADWQLPPALVSLYLWQNQLEGSFPAGLQLPAALRKLDVNNNLLR